MSKNTSQDFITTGYCDNCDTDEDTPLVFADRTFVGCVCCAPETFEQVARRDISAWLAGGGTEAFRCNSARN